MGEELQAGAYESLNTRGLAAEVERTPFTPRFAEVSAATAPEILARHVADALTGALSVISDPAERISKVNELLASIGVLPHDVVALEQLITLTEHVGAGVHRLIPAPTIKLSDVALLTNAQDQPNLGAARSSELGVTPTQGASSTTHLPKDVLRG